MGWEWWLVLCGALLAGGCGDCPREGCDAMGVAAGGGVTGIAGAVASSSDVTANGCTECPLDGGDVEVYPVDVAVGSDAEAAQVISGGGQTRLFLAGRYAQALAPGRYLVCTWSSCVNAAVADGRTSTVNIKFRNGRTSFYVLDSDHAQLAEDFGFDVLNVQRPD